ncbi:penicillin-binding protein 1C [Thalassospira lucentensis]|uniref:penicillin-binding protein 1C n=1 Tax=Thalassospira lucentensis TaxID=168935 RepID=UPI003AA9D23D
MPGRVKKWVFGTAGVCALAVAGLFVLDWAVPPNLSRLGDLSVVVEGENDQPLRVFGTNDGLLRLETNAAEVDPKYLSFLMGYEDQRFESHFGVDPLALLRALGQWAASGHIVSGGSTLTMQVARLLEPRDRTLVSKGIEILRAIQLERHFSKSEILDMYVTLAPFGGRLEGVRSASLAYFGKEPGHLTIAEAALLTVLPQSPSQMRPDRFPDHARAARAKVLDRLRQNDLITAHEYSEALGEPVPHHQYAMPMLAPHLSEQLVASHPDQTRIKTTINPRLQADLQKLVEFNVSTASPELSVAIMVVENKTRHVVAHLGSRDYLDVISYGFVDMTRAVRSPGSTLKPFIYALSFDDRQTHPQTMIWDRSIINSGYAPSNFDHQEYGQISVADALRYSLNIPAVKVLERYGPIRFSQTMHRNGLDLRLPSDTAVPNLAIALGGVGVRLDDMMGMYRALASDRRNCALRYLRENVDPATDDLGQGDVANQDAVNSRTSTSANADLSPSCQSQPELVSRQTQSWITGILQNTPRPRGYQVTVDDHRMPIAFKTGTSYGYRDGWAFGYAGDYTVGVWVGKASGQPVPNQTGLRNAAPILFSVFEKLPRQRISNQQQVAFDAWKQPASDLLKSFSSQKPGDIKLAVNGLNIVSPADDAVFLLRDLKQRGLPLRARNGLRPLTWIVNGVPIDSDPWKRNVTWMPDGPGFYDITVLDRDGASQNRRISIRAEAFSN